MKFLSYNIDSQSFENIYILYILNTSYRSNYILQCADKLMYFHNLNCYNCYKVINVYLSNIHFHNTDTLIARICVRISIIISTPFNQSALFVYNVRVL